MQVISISAEYPCLSRFNDRRYSIKVIVVPPDSHTSLLCLSQSFISAVALTALMKTRYAEISELWNKVSPISIRYQFPLPITLLYRIYYLYDCQIFN